MTEIGRYFSYEEAHGWRLELLAVEIECRVDVRSSGLALMGGSMPVYSLCVSETDVERALAIVALPVAEDYQSIMTCPACGSNEVIQMRSLGNLPGFLDAAIAAKGAAEGQLHCHRCAHQWDLT